KSISAGCWVKIILLLAAILIVKKMDWLPSWNIFSSKPVTIDDTPILIKDIRSLGQVITATFYDEVVVDSVIKHQFPQLPLTDDHLVIIARGKVLAGIDLKDLADSSVTVTKDTVLMQLPPTKIIDVIINPGDYETFEETGKWSQESVTDVKLKAKDKITANAFNKNIIEKANSKAKAVLEDFFHAAGFKVVLFISKPAVQ
ncbi:MAG TPA: DUF4230 domain-containing protein, partial [Chitinophagaceae bacterium]|nr:DUF4230 domain-containing protein [Chitinophagaceae bacterium]